MQLGAGGGGLPLVCPQSSDSRCKRLPTQGEPAPPTPHRGAQHERLAAQFAAAGRVAPSGRTRARLARVAGRGPAAEADGARGLLTAIALRAFRRTLASVMHDPGAFRRCVLSSDS